MRKGRKRKESEESAWAMALLKIATHPEAVGKAKVGDDHVAALVQEQILELEISVDDPFL